MLFSEEHNFLYVHVSKTGGSNMERALRPFSHQPDLTPIDKVLSTLRFHWDYRRYRFKQHDSAAVAARVLPPEVFAQCFKFALVRNPWDWMVSLYLFLKRKESHRHHERVKGMSFAEYVDFEIQRDKRHQHRFVMDNRGKLLVDYLGRFEALEASFDHVCEKLNIPRPQLERISVFKRPPYQDLYDDALKDKVARHWRTDISAFGYEYEGHEPGDVVENFRKRNAD